MTDAQRAYRKAYYNANREKILARQNAWRKRNKEKLSAYNHAYYLQNKYDILEKKKHRRPPHNRSNVRYSVWDARTDEIIAIDLPVADCARLMGIKPESIYEMASKERAGKRCKWHFERTDEDEG